MAARLVRPEGHHTRSGPAPGGRSPADPGLKASELPADSPGVHPALLVFSLAFASAAALAGVVALRRDKTPLHWLLLGLLCALMVWTFGAVCRFSVRTIPGLEASMRLMYLGAFATAPLWVLVAGRYAKVRLLERSWVAALLLVPSLFGYLAVLTNAGHHLVFTALSFEMMERGAAAFAGPLYWVHAVWSMALGIAGSLIYAHSAFQLARAGDRRRALMLVGAVLVPLVASFSYLFRAIPFDVSPAALTVALLAFSSTTFRYRLFEAMPLARRDVIEHLPDGVVLADVQGVIVDLNPAAVKILRRAGRELRQRPLASILGALEVEEDVSSFRDELGRMGERREPLTAELRTNDDRSIELTAVPVFDARGERVGQYALLRDRTGERHFERIARQTQRLQTVGTLAAGVAHEVNNPLAFIRANLTQIERLGEVVEAHREGPDAKLAHELADLAPIATETLDGIQRIERIVTDMRRLSATRDQSFTRIDLIRVARDALRLSNLHRDARITTATRLAAGPLWTHGSAQRLVQALLNLIVNARQALEQTAGARITLAARLEDGQALVEVRDNGPGIPRELHERIFDPFFTTKDPDQGTGLGLAIAFDIARDHGGVIDVRSRPGEGATFCLRLPLSGSA
jgi:PAS domain S-box-containing protein